MKQSGKLFVGFVFLHKIPLSLSQAEEHSICIQHHPSCDHLAHLHCKVTDGSKYLVLCGEPLLQVPFLLQGIQHPQALKPSISNQPLSEGPSISSNQQLWASGSESSRKNPIPPTAACIYCAFIVHLFNFN